MSIRPDEEIILRRPSDPHAGTIRLPCGCIGLPWPIVHELGTNIDEIFCDKHGWLRVGENSKKRMRKEANQNAIVSQGTLFPDEPPY